MDDTRKAAEGVVWDLTPLFASPQDPTIAIKKENLIEEVRVFKEKYRGKITAGVFPEVLLEAIREMESIHEGFERLNTFAFLLASTDQQNQEYRNLEDSIEQLKTVIAKGTAFFSLSVASLSREEQDFLVRHSLLSNYRYYLERLFQEREHLLGEAEEKIVEHFQAVINLSVQGHGRLLSAAPFYWREKGKKHAVSLEDLLSKARLPDRRTRRRAYETIYSVLGDPVMRLTLTECYHNVVYGRIAEDALRNYKDPFDVALRNQQVDRKTTDALFSIVEQNYSLAHRYFGLKARILGLKRFELCDQYAPLFPGAEEKTYSFDEARRMVVDSYAGIHPLFGDLADSLFSNRRVHAEMSPRKRSGAFCAAEAPSLPCYVFLNYTGKVRDVSTLAHELGHGLHGELAKKQTMMNYDAPLAICETASTFGEAILFGKLFSDAADDRERLALIAWRIEDIFVTLFRQMTLFRFEEKAYAIRKERPFGPDDLAEAWLASQRPYYGEKVVVPDSYRWGWLYIPHFIHTRFYTWTYVFGCLLALSLWQQYRIEGDSFVPKLVRLLEAGGSDSPKNLILNNFGMDITTSEFWESGMKEVEQLVDEAESLACKLDLV